MTRAVRIDGEDFIVDVDDLAGAFDLAAAEVLAKLREGVMTSRCEKGIGEHAGHHRLIFKHGGRVLRLTVGGDGAIVSRVMFAPPPPARRCEKTAP